MNLSRFNNLAETSANTVQELLPQTAKYELWLGDSCVLCMWFPINPPPPPAPPLPPFWVFDILGCAHSELYQAEERIFSSF